MHIGLIGGIGPAATDFYYRALIERAAKMQHDLELTIVHADTPTLLGHLATDNMAAQCEIYMRLTERLAAAGACNVAVTSIAGHFCIDEFVKQSPLPVIDLTKAVSSVLQDQGILKVGIMGTKTVMVSHMYRKLGSTKVILPRRDRLANVHDAYVALATSGKSSPELRDFFLAEGTALMRNGADAVLIGGTDLNAIFDDSTSDFPVVDCAGIHIKEIAKYIA